MCSESHQFAPVCCRDDEPQSRRGRVANAGCAPTLGASGELRMRVDVGVGARYAVWVRRRNIRCALGIPHCESLVKLVSDHRRGASNFPVMQ